MIRTNNMAMRKLIPLAFALLLLGSAFSQGLPDVNAMSDEEFQAYIDSLSDEEFDAFMDAYLESAEFQGVEIPDPVLIIELDTNGNAAVTSTEPMTVDLDTIDLRVFPSGNALKIEGFVDDAAMAQFFDFTLSILSSETISEVDFDASGEDVRALIDQLGPFQFDITLQSSGDDMVIGIDATTTEELFTVSGLDVEYMAEEVETLKADLQDVLDEVSTEAAASGVAFQATLDELDLTIGTNVQLSLQLTVSNWQALYSSLVRIGDAGSDIFSCIGLNDLTMIGMSGSSSLSISGAGNAISVGIDAQATGATGASPVKSINLQAQKSGSSMSIDGELDMLQSDQLTSCLLKGLLGDFEFSDAIITLTKGSGDDYATMRIEADAGGVAKSVAGGMEVRLSEDVTSAYVTTVILPKGKVALEAGGVTAGGVGDETLTGFGAGEMYIVYGDASLQLDIDVTLIAGIVLLIIIILLLLRRRKRSA